MSRKRFVIILQNSTSKEQNDRFINWVENQRFGWWHWVGNAWLIVGNTSLSAADVRDKANTFFGMCNLVQEISGPYVRWAGFGPNGTGEKKNMFTWLERHWWG